MMDSQALHSVLTQVADELRAEWEAGQRTQTIELNDLIEVLRRIAQDLPAPE